MKLEEESCKDERDGDDNINSNGDNGGEMEEEERDPESTQELETLAPFWKKIQLAIRSAFKTKSILKPKTLALSKCQAKHQQNGGSFQKKSQK